MSWFSRVANVFRSARLDRALDEEITFHIESRIDDLVAGGMPREEAEATARRQFGNRLRVRESSRDVKLVPWFEGLIRDVCHAFRALRRTPGLASVAILTLAIGIGANAAVFSVVNSVLLRPLPYPDADQLVAVRHSAPGAPGQPDGLNLSPSMFFTYADENRAFQHVGIWIAGPNTVTGVAEPEEVRSVLVTHGVLEALNVQPALGRWLNQSDQTPEGPARLMLTYGYWQRRFGGESSIIGRSITVQGRPHESWGSCRRDSGSSIPKSTSSGRLPSTATVPSMASPTTPSPA